MIYALVAPPDWLAGVDVISAEQSVSAALSAPDLSAAQSAVSAAALESAASEYRPGGRASQAAGVAAHLRCLSHWSKPGRGTLAGLRVCLRDQVQPQIARLWSESEGNQAAWQWIVLGGLGALVSGGLAYAAVELWRRHKERGARGGRSRGA